MKNKILILIALIPTLYFILIANTIPDQIPIHYNAKGVADGFGSKYFYLLLGAIPLIIAIVKIYTDKFLNINKQYADQTIMAIVVFFTVLTIYLTNVAGSQSINITSFIIALSGLLFMYIGNFMNKLKRNKFIGIRIPATLKSDVVWNKTHYVGGYIFVAIGFITTLTSLIFYKNMMIAIVIMLLSLTIGLIYIFTYANKIQRQLKDEDNETL